MAQGIHCPERVLPLGPLGEQKLLQCRDPIVLPFYHSGMGRILPKGSVIPRVGQTVYVTVGEPIELRDLTRKCNCSSFKQSQVLMSLLSRQVQLVPQSA